MEERVFVAGTFDSNSASHLEISFEYCYNSTESNITCKPREEQLKWAKNNYIITLENEWEFRESNYNETKFVGVSRFKYYSFSQYVPQ